MKTIMHVLIVCICSMLILLAGCNSLTVSVSIDENGAGTRVFQARLDSELSETSSPTLSQACTLLGITPENGWKRIRQDQANDSSEKKRVVFERTTPVADAASWRQASGDLAIRGALDESGPGQLLFSNDIDLSIDRQAGHRIFRYSETFSWVSFLEYYTEYESNRIWRELSSRYHSLEPEDEIEIKALLSGVIAMATDLETSDEKCEGVDDILERTVEKQLFRIVHRSHPDVGQEDISPVLDRIFDDSNDQFEEQLQREMPGAYLATKTEIVLKVTFPGTLIESNAHTIEGQTASWTIHPLDAIARPLQLRLQSDVIE